VREMAADGVTRIEANFGFKSIPHPETLARENRPLDRSTIKDCQIVGFERTSASYLGSAARTDL
jgi:hypothetical protein